MMTEQFGLCGVGWKFIVDRQWTEQGDAGNVFAFVNVKVFVKIGDEWSEAIPGNGGSFLIEKESSGLHCNDEAYKMATTDALGAAMKMLGVGAEIYLGNFEDGRYADQPPDSPTPTQKTATNLRDALKQKARSWHSVEWKKSLAELTSITRRANIPPEEGRAKAAELAASQGATDLTLSGLSEEHMKTMILWALKREIQINSTSETAKAEDEFEKETANNLNATQAPPGLMETPSTKEAIAAALQGVYALVEKSGLSEANVLAEAQKIISATASIEGLEQWNEGDLYALKGALLALAKEKKKPSVFDEARLGF
jgi:hypothetical protein